VFQVPVVNGHDVFQGVFQPLERIHLMFFADGEEGIDHCCALCRFMAAGKQVVLATQTTYPPYELHI